MILSLRHNYIYIRTKKTGSSTIEWLLTQNLGPEDIVVGKDLHCLGPLLKPGVRVPKLRVPPTHVAADQIKPLLRDDFWNGAFKFTSERHPYEKAVSLAYWRLERMGKTGRHKQQDKVSSNFGEYLDELVRSGKYSTFRYYSIDGEPAVDDFIRLESLKTDLERIAHRIGITIPDELPRKRGESRVDRRPAKEILSAEQKDIVWENCRREFEILGYER